MVFIRSGVGLFLKLVAEEWPTPIPKHWLTSSSDRRAEIQALYLCNNNCAVHDWNHFLPVSAAGHSRLTYSHTLYTVGEGDVEFQDSGSRGDRPREWRKPSSGVCNRLRHPASREKTIWRDDVPTWPIDHFVDPLLIRLHIVSTESRSAKTMARTSI